MNKLCVAGLALSAVVAFTIVSQPVAAGSCTVVVAEGRGANEAKASARALKHLTFKINRWASQNGYTAVRKAKSKTLCAPKTARVHCTSSAKVCG